MTYFARGAAASSLLALVMALPGLAQAQDDLTVNVGGRINLDYTFADLDGPEGDINGSELRRARLSIDGEYGDNLGYKFELQTDDSGEVVVEDAYLQFKPKNLGVVVKVGHHRTTNSLDEQTSSRFTSVIERAAFTDAFGLDRRAGVSVEKKGSNYTAAFGVYSENLEGSAFDNQGSAISARATYNPIKEGDRVAHLGASWRFRDAAENSNPEIDGEELLRFRQRPFTHQTDDRIIETERFASSDNFFGIEAAYKNGPFWTAGEYAVIEAQGGAGNADARFQGYYGEVGMFFGGQRSYSGGKFGRPKVDNPITEGGFGAFSLTARVDVLDLEDGANTGQLDTYIIGADWYPTTHTRFAINAFIADATDGTADNATGIVSRMYFDF